MSATVAMGPDVAHASWPATADGDDARRWVIPFATDRPARYVANIDCQVGAVLGAGWALPVTTTSGAELGNSYVVSPYTHYVSYLEEELRLVDSPTLRRVLSLVVHAVGGGLRRGRLDRVVTINNWLLSTNLYPELSPQNLADATQAVREAFPDHAIVFRSLNTATAEPIVQALAGLGFERLLSRRVHIFDARRDDLFRRKPFRRDWARIARQGYDVVPLTDVDAGTACRVVDLYRALYLEKYSRHNPAFTADFVTLAARERLLTLYGLMKDGRLDGVLGCFVRNGVMTTPLLGYDTALPPETGLYRMLTALLSTLARERGVVLHRSSGAATFKRSRGAVPTLEYSMVDVRHLPASRRAPWRFLRALANQVGTPLIERYDR